MPLSIADLTVGCGAVHCSNVGRFHRLGRVVALLVLAACGGKSQDGENGARAGSGSSSGGDSGKPAVGFGGDEPGVGGNGSPAQGGTGPGHAGAQSGGPPSAGAAGAIAGAGGAGKAGSGGVGGSPPVACKSNEECGADRFCAGDVCAIKAVQISTAYRNTCALLIDGSLRCWGENGFGQLGTGKTGASAESPVRVSGLPLGTNKAESVALDKDFTCAALSDGSVNCWGLGYAAAPKPLDGLPTQDKLTKLYQRQGVCGTLASGALYCWGTTTAPAPLPGVPPAPTHVVSGESHSCLLGGGQVWCWGNNKYGQLGTDSVAASETPLVVPSATIAGRAIVDLGVGDWHTCAAYDDGTVRCWGSNGSLELGVTGVTQSSTPLQVAGLPANRKVTASSTGDHVNCIGLDDHTVRCWGYHFATLSPASAEPVLVRGMPEGSNAVGLTTGPYHQCALLSDGSVWCWGLNLSGSLGNPASIGNGVAQRVAPW